MQPFSLSPWSTHVAPGWPPVLVEGPVVEPWRAVLTTLSPSRGSLSFTGR